MQTHLHIFGLLNFPLKIFELQ